MISEKTTQVPLSAQQLAALLCVSELTVVKLAKQKQIPCVFVKGRPKFDLNMLLNFFKVLEAHHE
ncbi:MAG: hypothetical protein LBG93_06130 [Treponema sp.]|jgi:hypothetical protein|nr:hypothetical protein [Treponema sp.]